VDRSHGRDLSRDWPKVEAGIGLPTELGGHEVRNGGFLRGGSDGQALIKLLMCERTSCTS
jgi:hypothetical protein